MKKNKLILALAACGLFTSMQAQAVTETATFGVSATILANCTLQAFDLDFGVVDLKQGAEGTTSVITECPIGTNGYVRVGGGIHNIYGDGQRHVAQEVGSQNYYIMYNLYLDQAKTQPLNANSSTGFGGFSITGVGEPVRTEIYGEIPVQLGRPGGVYRDTVQVTLDY